MYITISTPNALEIILVDIMTSMSLCIVRENGDQPVKKMATIIFFII